MVFGKIDNYSIYLQIGGVKSTLFKALYKRILEELCWFVFRGNLEHSLQYYNIFSTLRHATSNYGEHRFFSVLSFNMYIVNH